MKSVIWGNYKGGVGKTTSVFQVATYFAKAGKKVLLIDLDPQCSLSNICCESNNIKLSNFREDETLNYIIELYTRFINSKNDFDFSMLLDNIDTQVSDILKAICVQLKNHEFEKNLFFIPSSISFDNCRINELSQKMDKNIFNICLMQLFYNDISNFEFDYIFVDCPPTSNILIQSTFMSSDYYIVPTIVDEISTKGVADYITEIEKTRLKYIMNENIGSIFINKVFNDKIKFIGAFETIYKERRGNADNSEQIISLDKNISSLSGVKSLISQEKYKDLRYDLTNDGLSTYNIFKYYIGNRDNRSNGESIPLNTAKGTQTASYKDISEDVLTILEG